jgi:uncharacterized membrane protein
MLTPFLIIAILTSPWLLAQVGRKVWKTKALPETAGIIGLGLAFLFFALGHFVQADQMVRLVPPFVPFRSELIFMTGLLEIVIAILLFIPSTRRYGAVAAFAVLILFFPANVYGALNAADYGGHALGPIYLLIRLPLQLLLLFWTYWFGLRGK